jgi:hypothetical protein
MKYPISCLILTSLILSACEPITRSPQQLAMMNESQLCQLNENLLTSVETQAFLDNEMQKRAVDCDPQHQQCLSFGLQRGTQGYADCRLKLMQEANEQKMNQEAITALQQMQKTQIEHQQNEALFFPQTNSVDIYHHY